MRSQISTLLAAGAVLALVTGCASQPGGLRPGGPASPPPDPEAPIADAASVDLIDLWRVSGADGETADTWLRLDQREFQLWRECGVVSGSWRVQSGILLAGVTSASGVCGTGVPDVPWLDAVAGYSATDAGFDLVDAEGTAVASLTIDGAPEPRADLADSYAEPPEVTDEVRQWLAEPPALLDGFTAIEANELVGRWVPGGAAAATDAHVEFTTDGRWSGSDGCNGGAGRWAVGDDGLVVITSGLSTLMYCEGAAVPNWVALASRMGVEDGSLVMFGADGEELGRVARA